MDLCVYADDMNMAHQDREVLLTEVKLIGSYFSGHNVIADNEDMKYIGLSIARNESMDVMYEGLHIKNSQTTWWTESIP